MPDATNAGRPKKGGKRPRAGRKKAEAALVREELNRMVEQSIGDRIPELLDRLFFLAVGGYERFEDEYTAGDPESPGQERPLILVRRKRSVAEPDRSALIYLLDRVLGKPVQPTLVNGQVAVPPSFEEIVRKVYGESGRDAGQGGGGAD